MNILMINGTMRKGSTYMTAKRLLEKVMRQGDEIIEIFLPRELPEFCRGCGYCIWQSEKKCPDYLIYTKRITNLIDQSDMLVFTTPVLSYHASGAIKAFLDHYGYRCLSHRPEPSMFKKQALVVATAAQGGMKQAILDITDSLEHWGVGRIYTYGIALGKSRAWTEIGQKEKEKLDKDLAALALKIKRPDETTPSARAKHLFMKTRRYLLKEGFISPADASYWEEKGWLREKRPWK